MTGAEAALATYRFARSGARRSSHVQICAHFGLFWGCLGPVFDPFLGTQLSLLSPRHFWRPPTTWGCGIAHLEHSEDV